jgi:hypothetical protein
MSRSTQFIGLTQRAEKWLEYHGAFRDNVVPATECTGMFGEDLPMGVWGLVYRGKAVSVREVVQDEPWSSGPMIFTCLAFATLNVDGTVSDKVIHLTEWKLDKSLTKQYLQLDSAKGTYWV